MAPPSSSSSPQPPSSSASLARINNIASHISPAMAFTTSFPADTVPQAPEDPLFGLARAYRADNSPLKVDLVCLRHFPLPLCCLERFAMPICLCPSL